MPNTGQQFTMKLGIQLLETNTFVPQPLPSHSQKGGIDVPQRQYGNLYQLVAEI